MPSLSSRVCCWLCVLLLYCYADDKCSQKMGTASMRSLKLITSMRAWRLRHVEEVCMRNSLCTPRLMEPRPHGSETKLLFTSPPLHPHNTYLDYKGQNCTLS